tara:strand:+ start:17 stop:892 length:876 start_codon:yes stop_codon:yes gene_type:complete
MKKKLNTLVQDIYKELDGLSNGKALDISEQDAEDFGNAMKDVLLNWSKPYERKKETLRMSNIGKPNRQLWYDFKSEDEPLPMKPSTQIKFLYGHLLEEVVLMLVRLAGHKVTDEQKEVKVSGVLGHMDCIIDGEVIDVKSTSGFAFQKFRNGTLPEDDPFGYMAQLSGYETSEGTNNGGFLAINKETGELALLIPEEMDKPNIKHRIAKLKRQLKLDKPPNLCYNPILDGKAGNMKLPKQCVYCRHKLTCHKESNNGQGLRVFKYSKNLAFFTTVVKEPRVQEVTNEWQKS